MLAITAPTIALLIMGAVALTIIVIVLASRKPGPTGTSVYDSVEKPATEDQPPVQEASGSEEAEAADDEDSSAEPT